MENNTHQGSAEAVALNASFYKVKFENLPEKMKSCTNFINWILVEREKEGKKGLVKIPVNESGRPISVTNAKNYMDLDTAKERAEQKNFGLGFAITPSSGLVGIDIDHCRDAEGNLSELAKNIADRCNSYTEYSPSGNGIHIWIEDSDIEEIKKCRKANIGLEIYTNKRYFTVTGDHMEGTPLTVETRKGLAKELVETYIEKDSVSKKPAKHSKSHPVTDSVSTLSDEEIIKLIRKSQQGTPFRELFDLGDTWRYGGDNSAADMALMDILPFWTHGNSEQMERIFGLSALAERNKWSERPDYREKTIQAALKSWDGSFYGDKNGSSNTNTDELPLRRLNGKIIACAENFELILTEDKNLSGIIAYNQFERKIVKRKLPPWENCLGEWTDADDAQLRSYISRSYEGLRNTQILMDSLMVVSLRNAFHPVWEYLGSLKWDGKKRAETIFINALKVVDDEYARKVTWYWLKAAVKRIMEPGCKFDCCLVLAGAQGTGKSTILKRLAKSWFNDSINSIDEKDALLQLHSGSWIIELGEMQAARKSDNEAIKAFISRTTDIVRMPYDRRTQSLPRSCVFSGSTNDGEPLRDRTGGRRFWILRAGASIHDTVERLAGITDDYIDQVWAEVYHAYKIEKESGSVSLMPPSSVLERARELQEQSTEGSEMLAQVESFLNTPIPAVDVWDKLCKQDRRYYMQTGYINGTLYNGAKRYREYICSAEIANELFGLDNLVKEKATLREINLVMNNMQGWRKFEKSKRVDPYGVQRNVYMRIGTMKPECGNGAVDIVDIQSNVTSTEKT